MAKVGFSINEARGHMNPSLSLAIELRDKGHDITFVGRLDAKDWVEDQGFKFITFAKEEWPLGSHKHALDEVGALKGKAALDKTIEIFVKTTKCHLEHLPTAIKSEKFDLMVIDQTYRAASAVADKLKIPYVTICNALNLSLDPAVPPSLLPWFYKDSFWGRLRNRIGIALYLKTIAPITKIVDQFRAEHGLESQVGKDSDSKLLVLTQLVDEFEFPRTQKSQVHQVGPIDTTKRLEKIDFPWEKIEGIDFVYASLGTIQNRIRENFVSIAKACAANNLKLVMSTGGGASFSEGELPGDPIVVPFAPQHQLLEKAKMVITHCGMNTAMNALAHGLPMVAVPIANEQPGVAARVHYSGCGEVIPVKKLNAENLTVAIAKVWNTDSYRQNAQRIQRAIKKAGGAKTAAALIEDCLSEVGTGLTRVSATQNADAEVTL